jgi:uncharacterized protein
MPSKTVAEPQPFVVRRSAIQGRGCFASRDIRKGERIAEYEGERISWKEADTRYDDESKRRHHTFLFAVTTRTVIDGAVQGNDARFINHSCDPNCEAIDDGGRIFIEAMQDIAAGDELFYDYAYSRDESTTPEDEQLYVCRCGTVKCRGTILEAPKKKASLPKTHHAAARHPHEHLGETKTKTKSKAKTKYKTKSKTKSKKTSKTTSRKTTPKRGSASRGAKGGARRRSTSR